MKTLKEKVIVVTGAAQGLGRAIAGALIKEDARVVLTDMNLAKAKKEAEILGRYAFPLYLDVSDALQVEKAIREIVKKYGRIDAVVNNAGIDFTRSLDSIRPEEWQSVINVNLVGPYLLSRNVFPVMEKQDEGGCIINITSTAAKRAWENASAYHASKWGLLGLSHAMHVEGRGKKIKVTALVAGGMQTPFLLDRFPDIDQSVLQKPENVANVVKFLLLQPAGTVIPEVMVLPERETSWP